MATRRERLVGFRYRPRGALDAEVRKSCRDEWKIYYSGAVFDDAVWARLASLGSMSVLEASKLNPKMKDLIRIAGPGFRVEGARGGEMLLVFYTPPRGLRARHRVEALLAGV